MKIVTVVALALLGGVVAIILRSHSTCENVILGEGFSIAGTALTVTGSLAISMRHLA
jgi:hypothetical protein